MAQAAAAPLLQRKRSPAYSVQRLVAQGVVFVALGMLEVGAGAKWGHELGVASGAAAAAVGVALLAYAACLREAGAASAPATPRLPHQAGPPSPPRAAMAVANALGVFVLLLLAVRGASPDPSGPGASSFPAACTKPQGCGRVAVDQPHRAAQQEPLLLRTGLDGARAAAAAWVRSLPRGEVLYDGADGGAGGGRGGAALLRARLVSFLWGFADDFWVRLSCADDGRTRVEAMGQLRLGVGDLGVNPGRNTAFLGALRAEAKAGSLPRGTCGQASARRTI